MRRLSLSCAITALICGSASATLIGDFEYTGLPGGSAPEESWNGTGRAYTATNFGSVNPSNGNRLAVIRNDNRTTNGSAPVAANTLETATNATDLTTFENTFRVSGGAENAGSGVSATFTADANNIILFDWYFVTREDTGNGFGTTFNDFAYVTITGGGSVTPILLADGNNSINSGAAGTAGLAAVSTGSQGAGNVDGGTFENGTGWQTASFQLGTAGTYTISFGVLNVGDNSQAWPSALLIDNVNVVPEPGSIVAVLGLITLVLLGRLRKVRLSAHKEQTPQGVIDVAHL